MDLQKTVLGIELGSTRIKAVLLDEQHRPLASGSYEWENELIDGIWTYELSEAERGMQQSYAALATDVEKKYGVKLTSVGAIGISGMMHGYLPFDREGRQLASFRTWRNTTTGEAAEVLTQLFDVNVPQRWSIAHLYQAILNGEKHLPRLDFLTTLAGYIHFRLTGERVLGICEASGMFPVDSEEKNYDRGMMEKFDRLIAPHGFAWKLVDVLPKVRVAGDVGGFLTEEGAALLDPSGTLAAGIPVAPPEGDAGTGMAATNSVRLRTGNVSAGTSIFAMIVVDRPIRPHAEIDMVTTPDGAPVAMVHCNNCTSEINAWAGLFAEFAAAMELPAEKNQIFKTLFEKALEGEADCGGLTACNYLSGEGITAFDEGRPLFLRAPDSRMTLANFMRAQLFSALATLRLGMDILLEENVPIERLYGHGGYFRTPGVGSRMLSAAGGMPVSFMKTAADGGAHGMALLAAYMLRREKDETLGDYLAKKVFAGQDILTVTADEAEREGFRTFLARYRSLLAVERTAIEKL